MGTWVRRSFGGIGLTQSPPGPQLAVLQARHGGTVWLCIDVSYSMHGEPLRQAVAGGLEFLAEATQAHYRCGLVLWNSGVQRYVPPASPVETVRATLSAATSSGGTSLAPTLRLAIKDLAPLTGDRALCVFSDGFLSDHDESAELARQLCALGVRIITRGLGGGATLAHLTCPGADDDHREVESVATIGTAIASMATGVTRRD